jgi:carbon storage regulator CsrA
MLVLSRRTNEQIQIGEDISVTVLQIKGNRVRIGIEAPEQIRVLRSELPLKTTSHSSTPSDDDQSPSKSSARKPSSLTPELNVFTETGTERVNDLPLIKLTDHSQPVKPSGSAANTRLLEIIVKLDDKRSFTK